MLRIQVLAGMIMTGVFCDSEGVNVELIPHDITVMHCISVTCFTVMCTKQFGKIPTRTPA
jgi:hypothetical protein